MHGIETTRVATYEQAVEAALDYIKKNYHRVSNVKVERAYMQPHWEEGDWVVELRLNTRDRLFSRRRHLKLRVCVTP